MLRTPFKDFTVAEKWAKQKWVLLFVVIRIEHTLFFFIYFQVRALQQQSIVYLILFMINWISIFIDIVSIKGQMCNSRIQFLINRLYCNYICVECTCNCEINLILISISVSLLICGAHAVPPAVKGTASEKLNKTFS